MPRKRRTTIKSAAHPESQLKASLRKHELPCSHALSSSGNLVRVKERRMIHQRKGHNSTDEPVFLQCASIDLKAPNLADC